MKNCFFLWTNTSEVEQKQFGADQKSDRMENFALGQQISNGLVRNWKYLESYDFPFKNLNIFIASNTNPRSRTEWIYLHMNNLDFTMINFWLLPSFACLRVFVLSILHVPISIFATKDFHGVILDLSDAVIYEQPHSLVLCMQLVEWQYPFKAWSN